ncbi:related to OAR-1 3-oxoacyl-[acyl-carrier-protein]-reductase (oar-1) [Fusarium torulosum]|uniref:Related to OAR-1 3-oxoacyl-[acyl-carrier-protein]-reductase (Oar-1) n=1 Tax=Fusarium torulosum TaxID=33205 RepID=A0AAE8MA29_9HYPO|nr:related to OAR-1 3-oxoacyl-[acyl-carrier-protein]-reductase (oar-1) [Fusarium torulosum]
MSYSLRGKHCIVTGATGAIGFRIAAAFAEQGSVVSLVSRSAPDARARLEPQLVPYKPDPATEDPEDPPPSAHRFLHLDGTKPVMYQGFFGATVGRADILVNCAGIGQTSFIRRTYDSDITNILETNLRATILACKYARMRPNGCIINISSLMANKDGAGASVYAASKAGLLAFTRAMTTEFRYRSIRVNALLPGWIESQMWDDLLPNIKNKYLDECPAHRAGTPDEVADAAIFLAKNQFANNCVLNLDGGFSAA